MKQTSRRNYSLHTTVHTSTVNDTYLKCDKTNYKQFMSAVLHFNSNAVGYFSIYYAEKNGVFILMIMIFDNSDIENITYSG